MAASALVITKVVIGRIKTIDFLLGAVSAFGRLGMKDDVVEIEEIREKIETVLEDGQILREYAPGQTLQGTITLSELDTTSHTAIETANNINIVTATGGSGSLGVTFAAALDIIKVRLQGMKTVIEFSKSGVAVPYTITDN